MRLAGVFDACHGFASFAELPVSIFLVSTLYLDGGDFVG